MAAMDTSGSDASSSSEEEEMEQPQQQQEEDEEEKATNKTEAPKRENAAAFSAFMQAFWDLASNDGATRHAAAISVVRHLSGSEAAAGDGQYAVQRLVKGLCSSRDSARLGFAACLSQVLRLLPTSQVSTAQVEEKLFKVTESTGNIKGNEERDLFFGRMFGCVAIARSGRLDSGAAAGDEGEGEDDVSGRALRLLEAVVALYGKRRWLRQVASEAALAIAAPLSLDVFQERALPVLLPLVTGDPSSKEEGGQEEKEEEQQSAKAKSKLSIDALQPDQLLLLLGIHQLIRSKAAAGAAEGEEEGADEGAVGEALALLPKGARHKRVARAGKCAAFLPPLRASSSCFPKVHAAWPRLWADLGLTLPRPAASSPGLGTKRLKLLEELWTTVVDEGLANGTNTTKGLALLLLSQVMERVPPEAVKVVLSKTLMRVLLNHSCSADATLHTLARKTLNGLAAATSDSPQVQLELVSVLVIRGGVKFDSRTGTRTVGSLVEGMDGACVEQYIGMLEDCVLGKATSNEGEEGEGKGAGDDEEKVLMNRVWAVEVLHSLTKNTRLMGIGSAANDADQGGEERGKGVKGKGKGKGKAAGGGGLDHGQQLLFSRVSSFLLRVGFFDNAGAGGEKESDKQKKKKKKSAKKGKKDSASAAVGDTAADVVIPRQVQEACRSRFFSMLADISGKPLYFKGSKGEEGVLETLWSLHSQWAALEEEQGAQLLAELDEEGREAREMMLRVVGRIREESCSASKEGGGAGAKLSEKENKKKNKKEDKKGKGKEVSAEGKGNSDKLSCALAGVIMQVGLRGLTGDYHNMGEHLTDLIETHSRLTGAKDGDDEDDEDDDEDGDADPMAVLADVLVAIVAEQAGAQYSVRGMRETAKKSWTVVCGDGEQHPMTKAAIDCLLANVCGFEEEDDEEDGEDGEDDEDSADGSDEDGEDGEGADDKTGKEESGETDEESGSSSDSDDQEEEDAAKGKGKGGAANGDGDDDSDDEMVDADGLEDLLNGDEGEGLAHHAGADAALASLIGLKKQSTKAGRIELERQQMQIRLRALDLIEVFASRCGSSPLCGYMLMPVYRSMKRLAVETRSSEGRALLERLQGLYRNRLCRCKASPEEMAADGLMDAAKVAAELLTECRRAGGRTGSGKVDIGSLATDGLLCAIRLIKEEEGKGGKKVEKKEEKKMKSKKKKNKGEEEEEEEEEKETMATVTEGISECLKDFMDKKRSKSVTSGDLFTHFIRRFPEKGVLLTPQLLEACVTAKSDYLKAEAFRLLGDVVAQGGALCKESRQALGKDHCAAVLDALTKALSSSVAEGGVGSKAKRARPLLQCCGSALKLLKQPGMERMAAKYDAVTLLETLGATKDATESPAIRKMCVALEATLVSVSPTAAASAAAAAAATAADAEAASEKKSDAPSKAGKKEKDKEKKKGHKEEEEEEDEEAESGEDAGDDDDSDDDDDEEEEEEEEEQPPAKVAKTTPKKVSGQAAAATSTKRKASTHIDKKKRRKSAA